MLDGNIHGDGDGDTLKIIKEDHDKGGTKGAGRLQTRKKTFVECMFHNSKRISLENVGQKHFDELLNSSPLTAPKLYAVLVFIT